MLRKKIDEQNLGVFQSNIQGIKYVKNESVSKIFNPLEFKHKSTVKHLVPLKSLPQPEDSEDRDDIDSLDATIKRVIKG